MSFFNTELFAATSGIRNSGGIVNVAGPIFCKTIMVVPASGQSTAPSYSGAVLAVTHATSGMFAQLSGQELFRFDGGAHSGLGTGNLAAGRWDLLNVNTWCPSGIVTLNSGLHTLDLIVTFAT